MLKDKAPYLPIKYCQEITRLYPEIEYMYEENPYILLDYADELEESVTFEDIDSNIVLKTFDMRLKEIRAILYYVLKQNENMGNSWMSFKDLNSRVLNTLKRTKHPLLNGSVLHYLNYYNNDFTYDRKRNVVSITKTRQNEFKIYNGIKSLQKNRLDFTGFTPIDDTHKLSNEQLQSASNIVLNGGNISLLTGGPGTGKTTITKAIVKGVKTKFPNREIVLLAPTGKAAKRIKEQFPDEDMSISTIHLFVGWGFDDFKLKKVKDNAKRVDLVIIDESSMVGVEVLSRLFDMINLSNTKVIFIGDENQLPAIGTGDTINDLKAMDVYEEHLWINYRSSEAIIDNAKRLNNGDFRIKEDNSFEFIDINSCIAEALLSKDMADTRESKILLTPYRKISHMGNTKTLNTLTHREKFGENRRDYINGFCRGDKVIITKTNYKRKYFNGDTGELIGVCRVKEKGELCDAFVVQLYTGETIKVIDETDIDLAYAMTIHKSQGSEYDTVNIYIPEYSPFITKEMLYTAITRAKKKVKLWTTMDIYKKIVLSKTVKRNTLIHLWKNTSVAA